jgi:hypothetical protein
MIHGDLLTFVCSTIFVLGDAYILALWCYALSRTRIRVFYFLILCEALALSLAIVNSILCYTPSIGIRLLGSRVWTCFYYLFVCFQPMTFVAFIIALTLLVRRIANGVPKSEDAKP